MWNALAYVTTGISLAAFVGALAAWLLRAALTRREELIRTAPERDRARLVEASLESFRVDTAGLTRDQKYQLALQQIGARERRFKEVAKVVLLIALLVSALAGYAIAKSGSSDLQVATQSDTPATAANGAASPLVLTPFAKWRLVRRDEFAHESGWWTGQSSTEQFERLNVEVKNGRYTFDFALRDSSVYERFIDAPYPALLEFSLALDFRIAAAGSDVKVSVYFGKGGDQEYVLNTARNLLWLTRLEGSNPNDLVSVPLPTNHGQWQRLGIVVQNQIIRVFVDSESMIEFREAAFNGGKLGLIVGSYSPGDTAVVEFDNIEFRRPP